VSTPRTVVLVTGLSGSGKVSILRVLEDLGFEAVDNPPLELVESLAERAGDRLAIGVDCRSRGFRAEDVLAALDRLRVHPGLRPELVFAEAREDVLLRRYTETRRRHPLAPQGRVADGIAAETALTAKLRAAADLLIDTSDLPLPGLRQMVEAHFDHATSIAGQAGLSISLVSFAFAAGLPREADMVFDARFLRNPHYEPLLRPRTGLDSEVAAYSQAEPDYEACISRMDALLSLVLPRFVGEGKKYATIAVGCTGGRHRSVHLVDLLGHRLRELNWNVNITHRELNRERISAEATRNLAESPPEGMDFRPESRQEGAPSEPPTSPRQAQEA